MRRLSLFGLLLGLLLAVGWPAAGRAEGDWTVIGFSQAGVPLVVHRLGQGATRVLVMGGQHGGPEANTIELAEALLNHFAATPAELPPSVGLDVLVVANPDGAEVGSRQFLSGVDPNRNWGGSDWQRNAWDSNGVWTHDLGGP